MFESIVHYRCEELIFVIANIYIYIWIARWYLTKASSIFSAIVSSSRVFLNNRLIVPEDYAFYVYVEVHFIDPWPICEVGEGIWWFLERNSSFSKFIIVQVFRKDRREIFHFLGIWWSYYSKIGKMVIQIRARWGSKDPWPICEVEEALAGYDDF